MDDVSLPAWVTQADSATTPRADSTTTASWRSLSPTTADGKPNPSGRCSRSHRKAAFRPLPGGPESCKAEF